MKGVMYMNVSERNKVIQIKLLENNKSYKALADYLGISYFSLRRRKNGTTKFTIDEIKKIYEFLNCDIKELL